MLGRQSLDSLARRLLQPEDFQSGSSSVILSLGSGKERCASFMEKSVEELKKCGMWCQVKLGGLDMLQRVQCRRNPPLGEQGEQCSCSRSAGNWLGGGQQPGLELFQKAAGAG